MFDRITSRVAAIAAVGAFAAAGLAVLMGPVGYSILMLPLAAAMLLVGGWWLGGRAPRSPFHELAVPAAVATVLPLLIVAATSQPISLTVWILAALAAGTLGVALAETAADPYRQPAFAAAVLFSAAAAGLVVVRPTSITGTLLATLALAAATAVPGVIAAVGRRMETRGAGSQVRVVDALELGVIGITPAIALLT